MAMSGKKTTKKDSKPNYFKQVASELKKVNYPGAKRTTNNTIVVLVVVIVFAVFICALDFGLSFGRKGLLDLKTKYETYVNSTQITDGTTTDGSTDTIESEGVTIPTEPTEVTPTEGVPAETAPASEATTPETPAESTTEGAATPITNEGGNQ
ncbi:MAG: preprotein translocase subunit SecE [Clostridiales bacterium]|nr:preprotein translocase subunit SecE [Clostridiales bacterium]